MCGGDGESSGSDTGPGPGGGYDSSTQGIADHYGGEDGPSSFTGTAEEAYSRGLAVASYPEDDPHYGDPSRGTYTSSGQPTGTVGPGGSGGLGMTLGTLGFPSLIAGATLAGQALTGALTDGLVGPTETATGPGYGGSAEPDAGNIPPAPPPAQTAAEALQVAEQIASPVYQPPPFEFGPGWFQGGGYDAPIFAPYYTNPYAARKGLLPL